MCAYNICEHIYKPPLIKWPYKHKLWENLETAAFNPKLLQIGWPPEPICKESLPKWPPEGHSPQPSQGGRGGWQWACGLIVGLSFWMPFLGCFFRCNFWAFGHYSEAFGHLFWITLGCFFVAFSYLSSFLKVELPCRRELKNQGPRVTEMAQKSSTNCSWLWACFGKPLFQENIPLRLEKWFPNGSQIAA